ncbi:hypothetical protein [Candidatus Vampirococcus lugosii]|uniref:Schlafen AlbA-2 domain-containing protein n=1 Tax=Candidatus Vampirococcus lugosii TaxID=2789015 RepID=A0ABS5QNP2_9BACT|nr:hypothetical protein [Candidatus Vampirococcus lugosii]MBS8122544.1 hypothetical protein [Candidatus Vampirococcus lugosii]
MLDKIHNKLFRNYGKSEKKGIFLSGIDKDGNTIFSNGVIKTDENLFDTVNLLYENFVEPEEDVKYIVIDVVDKIQELNEAEQIFGTNVSKNGFLIICENTNESGLILPSIENVADAKHAISLVKNKCELSGDVEIYSFTTKKILVI